MKTKIIPSIAKAGFFIAMAITCAAGSYAQNAKDKTEATKQLVEAQHYVFVAQTALPMNGHVRQLTGVDYDLKVTKTSITAYLPYFGRAYSAPIDPSQGGIQFTSAAFNYTLTMRKKGGWDVQIKPTDAADVQQLSLTITETGYATLQVTSTNRQAISFNGYIEEIKEKKSK